MITVLFRLTVMVQDQSNRHLEPAENTNTELAPTCLAPAKMRVSNIESSTHFPPSQAQDGDAVSASHSCVSVKKQYASTFIFQFPSHGSLPVSYALCLSKVSTLSLPFVFTDSTETWPYIPHPPVRSSYHPPITALSSRCLRRYLQYRKSSEHSHGKLHYSRAP